MSKTLYELLEVPPNASAAVIRSAYRVHSQRWHPDKNRGDPAAADLMAQINQAYAILSDPLKRKNYDASLPTTLRSRTRFQATNPKSRGSRSSPPSKKSARKDDLTAPYFSMTSFFIIISLICFIAIIIYLVLFYRNDGSANANAELGKLRELVESIEKKERGFE